MLEWLHGHGIDDVGQHIAVEHQKALFQQLLGVLQRTRGTTRLGLGQETQADSQLGAVAQHGANEVGHEAAGHHDVIDAMRAQPCQHEDDERAVNQRDDRLGQARGQRPQPRSLATHQDHRLHQA